MRKYDIKNKRNIGIIIGISIIIIIMFSLVIKLFLSSDKKEYTVHDGALVFDKDKSIIKVTEDSTIKKKWNNKYYLKFKDNNYELGNTAFCYNEKKIIAVFDTEGRTHGKSKSNRIKRNNS